jgi:hypothetical protein
MARRWRLQTARFRDQRAAERGLWDVTGTVFDAFCRYVWRHCGMPGEWAGLAVPPAAEPYSWLPGEQAEFDRAVQWFMDSMVGKARDAAAFADPSTAMIDVHNPLYDGKPILPGQLRTSYELGVNRAVQVVGDNAPRLLGPRNAEAQREFLTLAFRRLSDGARLKLGDVLNGTPKTGQSVRDMLLSAMNEGQGALKTARQLRNKFREIDGYDWQRLARTETSFALNAGTQAEYLERGYRIPATETGAMIDLPPYHPNCLLPGTRIAAEGIAGHLRGYYRGPAVELTLSNGNRLAVTANHLILTPDGFVRAASLNNGSNVVCSTGSEWVTGANPHDDQIPPLVENVFDAALEALSVPPASVPLAAEDVHGDGAFMDGQVDIVPADGFLVNAYESALIEQLLDLHFEGGATNVLYLASSGYATPMLFALALATDCRVSRPDHPLSRLKAHIVRDKLLRFLAGTNTNTSVDQGAPDDTTVETVSLRQVLNALACGVSGDNVVWDNNACLPCGLGLGADHNTSTGQITHDARSRRPNRARDGRGAFSGPIAVCQVVDVRQFEFSGHVYDLQTFSSLYIANGVLASNCVCGTTVLPELGYIVPDVAATACQVCQAARIRAEIAVADKIGVERIEITPTPAPQPRVARRPRQSDTRAPTEPVNVGPVE